MFDEINEIHPLFKNAPSTTEFKILKNDFILALEALHLKTDGEA